MVETVPNGFKRKVLKLDKSPIDAPKIEAPGECKKRIVPTKSGSTFRDKHREIYLPILIQVIELRGKLEQMKNPDPLSDSSECPEQILGKLELLESDIIEAQRWCEGVVLQLGKAMEEARGLVPEKVPEVSAWDKITDKVKEWWPW